MLELVPHMSVVFWTSSIYSTNSYACIFKTRINTIEYIHNEDLEMKKIFAVLFTSLFIVGCASHTDYYAALDAANTRNAEIAMAKAEAERTRVIALAELASSGDETSRVAAVMALALSNGGSSDEGVRAFAPAQPRNDALEWTRVLAGPVTTLGMGMFGYMTSVKQIEANRDITLGSYDSMVTLGTQSSSPIVGDDFVILPDNSSSFTVTEVGGGADAD